MAVMAASTHLLPNIYLSQPVFRNPQYGDLTIGVGLSVPFGLETDYRPGWVGRYAGLRTKLTTFDIQPTIAYRLFDRISLGASLDIQYASGRLTQAIDFGLAGAQLTGQFEQALPALLAAQGVPIAAIPPVVKATQQAYNNAGFVPGGRDGISEVTGDDWSVGFTLGAIFEYWKGNNQSFFQDGRVRGELSVRDQSHFARKCELSRRATNYRCRSAFTVPSTQCVPGYLFRPKRDRTAGFAGDLSFQSVPAF